MKNKMLVVTAVVMIMAIGFSYVYMKRFLARDTMPIDQVCERWGSTPFDANAFAQGDEDTRASMACDLIKNNQSQFVGKPFAEIRDTLGSYDGYYMSKIFPAYIIKSSATREEAIADGTWQLLFRIGGDQKISEIVVHRNCCD